MAVFRVERTKGFTVMSNYHLNDKTISLKAKGFSHKCCRCPNHGISPCAGWHVLTRKALTPSARLYWNWKNTGISPAANSAGQMVNSLK